MPAWLYRTAVLNLCVLLAGGCRNTPSTDTGVVDTDTTTTESPDECIAHEAVDDCCCFSRPESGYGLDVLCPAEDLCPRIGLQCANALEDCTVVSLPEEVGCLLKAMSERQTGFLRWDKTSLTAPWGVDEYTESDLLYIDGQAAFLVRYHFDQDRTTIAQIVQQQLKPVAFFEGCLDGSPSLEDQMHCVEDGFEEQPGAVCLAGYEYPKF